MEVQYQLHIFSYPSLHLWSLCTVELLPHPLQLDPGVVRSFYGLSEAAMTVGDTTQWPPCLETLCRPEDSY